MHTDYGRPIKLFFIEIPNFWGIWGIFERFISNHFGTVIPLSMFSINQLFLQKTKPLYPNPKYLFYLGLGFEFKLQIIRDLAIVCP